MAPVTRSRTKLLSDNTLCRCKVYGFENNKWIFLNKASVSDTKIVLDDNNTIDITRDNIAVKNNTLFISLVPYKYDYNFLTIKFNSDSEFKRFLDEYGISPIASKSTTLPPNKVVIPKGNNKDKVNNKVNTKVNTKVNNKDKVNSISAVELYKEFKSESGCDCDCNCYDYECLLIDQSVKHVTNENNFLHVLKILLSDKMIGNCGHGYKPYMKCILVTLIYRFLLLNMWFFYTPELRIAVDDEANNRFKLTAIKKALEFKNDIKSYTPNKITKTALTHLSTFMMLSEWFPK